jgi:non-ribosomal peptide synthetase-like protein
VQSLPAGFPTHALMGDSVGRAPSAQPSAATEKLLAEVLAVILRIDSVPVDSHFFDDLGADSLVMAQFCARVRKRSGLPSVSMKDVYQHPTIASLSAALAPAAPVGPPHTNQVGGQLAEMLAAVLGVESVSVDSHFFDDLGADSLVMAQFCARVRKHPDLPSVTMKDVYQHPTIAALSTALTPAVAAQPEASVPPPVEVAAPARRLRIVLCGLLQLLIFLAYSYLAAFVTAVTFGWISAASGLVDTYLRSALAGGALFIAACLLPVLAKWVLIGRWKPHQEFRIWGLKYVRFWTVKTLIRANPIAIFAGSPLYALYLRLLGAKIGRGAVIMSKSVPVCTDLLTIGSGTVIRKQSFFQGYRAHAGRIQTGSVTIGSDVFIGDKTVLDINTGMGDGAQLGHTSSLHSGAWVPAGEHWHGSPAQRTDVDYVRVPGLRCGTFRRISAAILSLLGVFLIVMPLIQGGMELVLSAVPSIAELVQPGQDALGTPNFFLNAAFVGGVVVGWLFVMTVPRALNLFITPEKVYPLYGLHYSLSHAITRMTNVKFFTHLFGNSSYSVYYLRRLGYKLFRIKQTGSNFGDEVAHDNPYLCSVGRGTVVADGLAMLNAEYSSTSIRLSRVAVGHRNFLGNNIAYPPQGRTGDNCLLATKVMIPLDGPIREGVGLLGSPPFEIPRSVERDNQFNQQRTPEDMRRGVAAKKRYNLRTMGVFLFVRWLHLFLITVLGLAAADLYEVLDHVVVGAYFALSVLLSALYYILVERCFTAFRRLKPRLCSYYEPYFWWHERLWKVPADTYLNFFNGTPFKNLIWRLLGVRLGRGVFDDGCYLTERTLVSIGDHVMLNAGSKVQCHSQEDGAFKSDHTVIGADCTLGVGAFVHYGVTIGDGAVLDADSFLMKGETVPPATRWGGNPAAEVPAQHVVGSNDPLPTLPVIRPGGRHHLNDEDDLPVPAPAPRPSQAPGPMWAPAPAPRPPAGPAPTWAPVPAQWAPAPGPTWAAAQAPRWAPQPGPTRAIAPAQAPRWAPQPGPTRAIAPTPAPRWGPAQAARPGQAPRPAPAPLFHPEPPGARTQPIGRHRIPVVRPSNINGNGNTFSAN